MIKYYTENPQRSSNEIQSIKTKVNKQTHRNNKKLNKIRRLLWQENVFFIKVLRKQNNRLVCSHIYDKNIRTAIEEKTINYI